MLETKTEPIAKDTHSGLPEFWDRNALYFANLMSLFFGNEIQINELAAEIGEVDTYGGRLVPVLNTIFRGKNNVLVLEREPDRTLCQYFANALDLDLPRIEVLSHKEYTSLKYQPQTWAKKRFTHDAYWIDGYVTDDILTTWASSLGKPTISTEAGSHNGNNKRLLYEFLSDENLPTPSTRIACDSSEVVSKLVELRDEGFRRAAIRASVGASGIGMAKTNLEDHDSFPVIPDHFFHEGPCLVQGWIEKGIHGVAEVSSPSVQMFLDESTVHLFDVTEQILSSESIHEGNLSPPPFLGDTQRDELIRQAGLAGKWLHQQGYRGTASADFIVASSEAKKVPIVYVCEINARITGATYPSVLARRFLPNCSWFMRNLRLDTPIKGEQFLQQLDDNGLLYRAGDSEGALPINFNFDREGLVSKGQLLFLGENVDRCLEFFQSLKQVDQLSFRLERD